VVSFKLETDPAILITKARRALENYGHSLVVANLLSTRKNTVTIVSKDTDWTGSVSEPDIAAGVVVEDKIIDYIVRAHEAFRAVA